MEQRNKVRGLAHDRNVAKVTVVAVPDRPGIARAIFDPLAEAGVNVDMIVQNVGHGGETDLSFTVPRVELGKAKKTLDPVVRELGARELTTDASGGQGLASSAPACTTPRATPPGCSGRSPTRASTSR